MAVTSTPQNACDASIYLADETGVMRDISGQSNQVSLPRNINLADFMVFGNAGTYRLACKKDWSVTLQVIFSMSTDEATQLLDEWYDSYYTQARRIQINVPNNSIGSRRYEGYAFLESLEMPLDAGEAGPIQISATLQGNGLLDYSTVTTS
jgi:hypothetical protein